MEVYILKSAAILAILFAFYKLVLENTSIHTFKRFYLFGILLASFLIPFITFTSYVEVSPVFYTYTEGIPQIAIPETEETMNYWPIVLWTIYYLGVLFFSVKFFRNLFIIIQQIRTNPKYRNGVFINVLLSQNIIPHTFFNYIFLNKNQFEKGEIPSEVILHEQTHAIQKHTLEVIFVELLQIVFWFNPLFYFLKKSIKLNHEFLADRAVLNAGTETSEYQKILLAFSSNAFTPVLAHSINYSSIKKRFTVMKTHTSKRAIWLRSLLLLPLLCVLIYGFSSVKIVQKTNDTIEISKEKATKAEIAEYNQLAKKYNAVAIEKRIIKKNDLERLETIYRKMNLAQRAKAQPFPECNQTQKYSRAEDNKKFSEAHYYYKGARITFEKANELLKENNDFGIYIDKSGNGPGTVHIYQEPFDIEKITSPSPPLVPVVPKKGEKNDIPPPPPAPKVPKAPSANDGNLYMAAEAPPAPNPDPVEYIKELAKKGATFYIGPHKYSRDEAIELLEKSTNEVSIDVSKYPLVFLGGC